ncbi:MAG: hypothetical protein ACRDRK_10105, partial [Pseudonocardia sp.]
CDTAATDSTTTLAGAVGIALGRTRPPDTEPRTTTRSTAKRAGGVRIILEITARAGSPHVATGRRSPAMYVDDDTSGCSFSPGVDG